MKKYVKKSDAVHASIDSARHLFADGTPRPKHLFKPPATAGALAILPAVPPAVGASSAMTHNMKLADEAHSAAHALAVKADHSAASTIVNKLNKSHLVAACLKHANLAYNALVSIFPFWINIEQQLYLSLIFTPSHISLLLMCRWTVVLKWGWLS
jgi:hypothetical protein